ncbi:unnamed protein product [Pocillopora meandrina]|uniref:Uncharacterized protein n=1 Tax=Pocillopora meandrina TaxID=46732 RepID=A0AAU9WR67_9CNID|nr:unnamed protein product [Pocillopora meandrina]
MMEMVELLLSTKLVKSIPTLLFAGHQMCVSHVPNFTLEQRKVPNKIRGVTAASTVTLPSQAKNTKQKVGLTPGTAAKKGNDPLLAVLKLKKSTFPGSIREVVCNDLPTIMLYTDSQPEKIVKFCYHNLAWFFNWV